MPKNYQTNSKNHPKKTNPEEKPKKKQPKTISITTSKSYWLMLTYYDCFWFSLRILY